MVCLPEKLMFTRAKERWTIKRGHAGAAKEKPLIINNGTAQARRRGDDTFMRLSD